MVILIIFSLLFFLPILVLPFGSSYFEIPKVIAAQILVGLLLIISFIKQDIKLKLINPNFRLLLSGIIILTIIQLVYLPGVLLFFGNLWRLQGIFLLWVLVIFTVISSRYSLKPVPYWTYLIVLLVITAFTILIGKTADNRAYGTVGEPNSLAAAVVFIWPFISLQSKKWWAKLSGLALCLLVIILSGSRSGLIALLIQLSFILLVKYLKIPLLKAFIVGLILIMLSLALPWLEPGSVYENRPLIWATAVRAGLEKPIIGGGFGNIENDLHNSAVKLNNNLQYLYVDSSHNIILDWWVTGGIIGVGILLMLIGLNLKNYIKNSKELEITIMLGILTALLFNPVSVVILLQFWWLIGQGLSVKPQISG